MGQKKGKEQIRGRWRKWYALALAAPLLLGMLPAGRAQAKIKDGITFTPMEYNMENRTCKIAISTEENYLAYYVYQPSVMGSMTNEEMFAAAEKNDTRTAEVIDIDASSSFTIYVWTVDAEGNCVDCTPQMPKSSYGDFGHTLFRDDAESENPQLTLVGGEVWKNPAVSCEGGVLKWTHTEEYGDEAMINIQPFRERY